jgi:Xaa-Pro aminopeptidase
MFQSYDDNRDPSRGAERIAALHGVLKEAGLDGFIVPRADEHQGEYVPACAERLAWLTGFSGSAGTAVILAEKAAIFIDGRYALQVRDEVDTSVIEPVSVIETPPSKWLAEHAPENARIGFDPWLMTRAQIRRIRKALARKNAELVPVDANPVDAIWSDRPAPPRAAITEQPVSLAGRDAPDKLTELARLLAEKDVDAAVLTDPASIAWTFNIRGKDVPHTPLALSFAVLRRDGRPQLFIDTRKLSNAIRAGLAEIADLETPGHFAAALAALGEAKARILYDPNGSAEAVAAAIEAAGGTIVEGADPVALPKARKNAAELAGARAAHIRDGAAMLRFLYWLERRAPAGGLTEIDAAKKLESFRKSTAKVDGSTLEDVSFDTISSTGPNAAINHYRVSERTNRTIAPGDLYLVDSGGQYRDGTTDITRTILIGEPIGDRLDLYRDRYTRVLKGHIAIARLRFPKATSGAQIDALARAALWSTGLDFDHGTGHGVGAFLAVHEGPQRIAKTGHTPLEAGMIVSNEPGFYVAGDFGIRIENLIVVSQAEPVPGGCRDMLSFETITLAPIEKRLINSRLLSAVETAWLDLYHQRVFASLSGWPGLTGPERAFLADACRPLAG